MEGVTDSRLKSISVALALPPAGIRTAPPRGLRSVLRVWVGGLCVRGGSPGRAKVPRSPHSPRVSPTIK